MPGNTAADFGHLAKVQNDLSGSDSEEMEGFGIEEDFAAPLEIKDTENARLQGLQGVIVEKDTLIAETEAKNAELEAKNAELEAKNAEKDTLIAELEAKVAVLEQQKAPSKAELKAEAKRAKKEADKAAKADAAQAKKAREQEKAASRAASKRQKQGRKKGRSKAKATGSKFTEHADNFRATGVLPPSIIGTDAEACRGAVAPKMLGYKDAEAELAEQKDVKIPKRLELTNHSTRSEFNVERSEENVAAAGKAVDDAETHFNATRQRAAACIIAAVVAATARYATAVEQADVETETAGAVPPLKSSRDACSAALAALGNAGPMAKDAKVQVVVNNAFVDAIVVGQAAPAAGAAAAPTATEQWDVLVFAEELFYDKAYTAGCTRAATFSRADIYDGGEKIAHALPASCFQVSAGAGGNGEVAAEALQHAQADHTDPGYALILLAHGEDNLPEFADILDGVAAAAAGSGAAPGDVGAAVVGPIKTMGGAARKAKDKYGGAYDKVGDIVRGTVACKTFLGVRAVVVAIFQHAGIVVIRFKDRLHRAFDAAAKSGGYRDILINVRMLSTGMLAEIQITLQGILAIKNSGAHDAYDVSRVLAASSKVEGAFTAPALLKIASGLVSHVDVRGSEIPVEEPAAGAAGEDAVLAAVLAAVAATIVPALASKTCFLRVLACDAVQNLKGVRLDALLTDAVLGQLGGTLQEVGFNDCGLVGPVPAKLWTGCTNLVEARFESNKLTGDVLGVAGADGLAGCTRLKVVIFGYNGQQLETSHLWKGVMAWCRSSIVTLNLAATKCAGTIPTEIGNCVALKWLHLFKTQIAGPIPTEIGNCVALETLWLSNTQIAGPIPTEIGNCVALETLRLDETQVAGPIPTEIGNCVALEVLNLAGTQIAGPIPTEIGNCVALEALNLGGTQIAGPIPTEIGNCVALETLRLDETQIAGPIPTEIGNCVALETLYLYSCKLTGAVPVAALAKCTQLKTIWLNNNAFDGDAAATVAALTAALPAGCEVALW